MQERSITVDGLELRLAEAGEGEPVLFVHGLGGAWTSWRLNLEDLASENRVLAPTLPGFGRSAKPPRSYEPAFFVDVLVELLDELGLASAHVVGTSMGGQASLELALRHPESVRRVLTVAPAGVPPGDFEGTEALATYRGITGAETEDEVVAVWKAIQPDGVEVPEPAREPDEVLAYVESPGAERAFASALRESARARRLGPLLDEVEAPLLVAWGTRDPMIPWDVVRPVLEETAHPLLAVFDGCGHSPHTERPGTFGTLARAFLDDELATADLGADVRLRPPQEAVRSDRS